MARAEQEMAELLTLHQKELDNLVNFPEMVIVTAEQTRCLRWDQVYDQFNGI